jgi:beta-phosphoglucomutase
MFDTVLFEFEGVIADTSRVRSRALQQSLAEEGLTITDDEFDESCAGFPVRDCVIAALALRRANRDETDVDLIALRTERYFAEMLGKGVSLCPGAHEFVTGLTGRSRLGIVTRARRREVDYILDLAGLDAAFECIVSADDVNSPKPSPEPYEKAIERLARRRISRPGATLALEDAPTGILAAKSVKVRCVAVGRMPVYHAVNADAYVPSLEGQTLDSLAELVRLGEAKTR